MTFDTKKIIIIALGAKNLRDNIIIVTEAVALRDRIKLAKMERSIQIEGDYKVISEAFTGSVRSALSITTIVQEIQLC